ncbi:AAA family ATPase [Chitinophaga sp.]|uniref:AAA family ATPase n=1 Tax=Chitinophaga sp. TaxID=1869181 RepID=UPI0031D34CE3
MISKIDIFKFGLFCGYEWNKSIGKEESFRRLNIIYGRNYSGKTTLSRIMKCLEQNKLHKDYNNGNFNLMLADNSTIRHNTLESFPGRMRVYNTDFIRENLSWLHKEDGSIVPFTILGAKNIELETRISEINSLLGNAEDKNGLLHEYNDVKKLIEEYRKLLELKNKSIDDKLRNKANDNIKIDKSLFIGTATKKNYTITDIIYEINLIKADINKHILPTQKVTELTNSLNEIDLPDIIPLREVKPSFIEAVSDTAELLSRKIKPTKVITDLIEDSLLQEWVRQGIGIHNGIKETCGFCGSPIPLDLWDKLAVHFSQESEALRTEIIEKISRLKSVQDNLSSFITLDKNLFYQSLQGNFEQLTNEWTDLVNLYKIRIGVLVDHLKKREENIFQNLTLPELNDYSDRIYEQILKFNALVKEHNIKTKTLVKDQMLTRELLRYSNIAQFIKDIDYDSLKDEVQDLDNKCKELDNAKLPLQNKIDALIEEKRKLESEMKDESKGAELINQYLSHFFGHNELKLVAEGEAPKMHFSIKRDNFPANNLSEGECSLISFCYFIAKIEDELKDESISKNMIIYIDDPISSLDYNHIFFMFSLIENVIAKPQKYGQLFISTHNLDFLKYLKQLTYPKYKPQPNSKDKADHNFFMIERQNKTFSIIRKSPAYMKDYVTEFNYLFHQIYNCSILPENDIAMEQQFNFGNNLRKFLEAYTFYKYPSNKIAFSQRLEKFFEGDRISMTLVFRMTNEYSHLENQFDRSMIPIEVSEISKIAKAVIEKIKQTDLHQYNSLMESIN